MPKEDELEREWRLLVSKKLDDIDGKADSIEKDLHAIEIELSNMSAIKLVPRLEKLEEQVSSLEAFKGKLVAVVIAVQMIAAAIWGLIKFTISK